MTDNFAQYKNYIIKTLSDFPECISTGAEDRYFVIELIRRGKDNPELPAANMHFKNYYIYCLNDLDKYELEIKFLCDNMRMRAYASVTYKSAKQVALDTMYETARRIANHDYKKMYSVYESCSGSYCPNEDRRWVVDIDNTSVEYVRNVINGINKCDSDFDKVVVSLFRTKSGCHIITHPFNLQQFRNMGHNEDIKKNHLTLLYENL